MIDWIVFWLAYWKEARAFRRIQRHARRREIQHAAAMHYYRDDEDRLSEMRVRGIR